jgi:hypothetical protein
MLDGMRERCSSFISLSSYKTSKAICWQQSGLICFSLAIAPEDRNVTNMKHGSALKGKCGEFSINQFIVTTLAVFWSFRDIIKD